MSAKEGQLEILPLAPLYSGLLALNCVIGLLGLAGVGLRIASRKVKNSKLHIDDWLAIAASVRTRRRLLNCLLRLVTIRKL
jgi:hypothetical protein